MIKKLSIDQQKTIYAGAYYCKFDDGYVLVGFVSGEKYLYSSWEKASATHPNLPTFGPRKVTPKMLRLRKINENIHISVLAI